MSGTTPTDLDGELLDDFYAECDELCGQIRVLLTGLTDAPAGADAGVEALYRAFHSFKGICGIVGLAVAERLAHAAEDLLRHLNSTRSAPSPAAIELLSHVLHRLEQIVAAHRLGQALPVIDDLLAPLATYRTTGPAPGRAGDSHAALAAPLAEGSSWRAHFTPTPELDARGVNIGSIRQRLSALGVIEKAEPRVHPGGGISFEFTLRIPAAPPAEAELEALLADGLRLAPEPTPAAAPAPAAVPVVPAAAALSIAPSHIIRVDMSRLDDLMRITGELVIHRSRLEERIARLAGAHGEIGEVGLALSRSLRDLRAAVTRVRMVPVAEIFTRMPYAVRELAQDQGKQVRLALHGQETEIDKYLVERLKEPLLHLVRNAVSHGLETPAERAAAGKPEQATLTLRATGTGHSLVLKIEDDGRGVDPARIFARAKALGIPLPAEPGEAGLLSLLCRPGFSTREEADLASGRGVGMAAVHATLRELGGVLTLHSEVGRFTRFTLRLPLTLSIIDTFIVAVGAQTCAIPRALVEEIVQFEENEVRPVKQAEVIPYRDGVLPIYRLDRFLGAPAEVRARVPALVVASERGLAGLVVDRVIAHREVVVRPMGDPLLRVPGIAGATELGDGRPVLILDPSALTCGAARPHERSHAPDSAQP